MNYPSALAALKQADPILADVIERVGLCTLQENQRTGDLLLSLSESILHQQLSTKVAVLIHQRFLQRYRTGIRRVYGLPELPDKKAVAKMGQRWKPYSTIASWYLWRSLEFK